MLSKKGELRWSELVIPKRIRFTPYTFVSMENDVVFTKEEIKDFLNVTKIRGFKMVPDDSLHPEYLINLSIRGLLSPPEEDEVPA